MMSVVSLSAAHVLLGWSGQQALLESLLWFGGLLLALMGGIVGVIWWRRTYWRSQASSSPSLTLDDLRRHHREGRLTHEEYESLRKTVLSAGPGNLPK